MIIQNNNNMPSLKASLAFLIQSQGEVSLDQCHELAESLNYKQATAERELRILSREGKIQPIKYKSKKGITCISGYRKIQTRNNNQFYDKYQETMKKYVNKQGKLQSGFEE